MRPRVSHAGRIAGAASQAPCHRQADFHVRAVTDVRDEEPRGVLGSAALTLRAETSDAAHCLWKSGLFFITFKVTGLFVPIAGADGEGETHKKTFAAKEANASVGYPASGRFSCDIHLSEKFPLRCYVSFWLCCSQFRLMTSPQNASATPCPTHLGRDEQQTKPSQALEPGAGADFSVSSALN